MIFNDAVAERNKVFFEIKSTEPLRYGQENIIFLDLIALPSDLPEKELFNEIKQFEVDSGSFRYVIENKLERSDLTLFCVFLMGGTKTYSTLEAFLKNSSK